MVVIVVIVVIDLSHVEKTVNMTKYNLFICKTTAVNETGSVPHFMEIEAQVQKKDKYKT